MVIATRDKKSMLRVIGVLIFALIVLGLAGHLFYSRKGESETGHNQSTWMHHLAQVELTTPASLSGARW